MEAGFRTHVGGEGFASGQELWDRMGFSFIQSRTLVHWDRVVVAAAMSCCQDHGALTTALWRVGIPVLVWTRRIRYDPNITDSGVTEQFRFDEDHISCFSHGKHYRPWSRSRDDFQAILEGKRVEDAWRFKNCTIREANSLLQVIFPLQNRVLVDKKDPSIY